MTWRLGILVLASIVLPFSSSAIAASRPAPHAAAHSVVRAPKQPDVKSSSVLVLDADNSSVLFEKHADVATPIASITKLMTCLVVLEAQQPLDEPIEITKDDRSHVKGAASRLPMGTRLTRGDLMHLALMASENRAAHALGRNYPGGLPAVLRAMNAKAVALGMTHTRFVDPTGLSSQNVATPKDLAKLVIAASRNATIRQYSTSEGHAVQVGRRMIEYRNTNLLVSNPTWDIIVQKTGYIAEAGKCLVMRAVIADRSVVIVLLDSFGKYTRVADAKRIKKWMEAGMNVGEPRLIPVRG